MFENDVIVRNDGGHMQGKKGCGKTGVVISLQKLFVAFLHAS